MCIAVFSSASEYPINSALFSFNSIGRTKFGPNFTKKKILRPNCILTLKGDDFAPNKGKIALLKFTKITNAGLIRHPVVVGTSVSKQKN